MRGVRTLALAAVTASTLTLGSAPAEALTAAAIVGEMTIGCFGCGTYGPAGNSGTFSVTGVFGNVITVLRPASATYTVHDTVGATCVVSSTIEGAFSVDTGPAQFTSRMFLTRIGGAVLVAMPDLGVNGAGTFAVTSPVGNPCGGAVSATVTAALVGV